MKIICIGRNFVAHIEELKNEVPTEPVVFLKPDTALYRSGKPLMLPTHVGEIHHELEIVLKIEKEGKYIQEKFANRYYSEISLGIDFTARDLQSQLKSKGLPWERAKAFDNSAVVGTFVNKESLGELNSWDFTLLKNKQLVQQGNPSLMIYNFDFIVSYVSQYFTLKKGDLIYTGTPAGVGPIQAGDQLQADLKGQTIFDITIA